MASTLISYEPPPNIDPTKATLAYLDRAIPRIIRELNSDVLLTRQRSIKALVEYLHDHEHIVDAIRHDIVSNVLNLLKETDIACRCTAAECFYVISIHTIGRNEILEKKVLPHLAELFDDAELIVRKNVHMTLEMLSENEIGAEEIIKSDSLIGRLIEKVQIEPDEIKIFILDTLHFCFLLDTDQGAAVNAMRVLTQLLSHDNEKIKGKASRCILDLATSELGKRNAIEEETVAALVPLLKHEATNVRSQAAAALAFICVITHGKYAAINLDAITPLLPLIDDSSSEVRSNSLKAITCLAEAPEGRRILLDHIGKIKIRISDSIQAVSKQAQIAYDVITWKP